MWGWEGCVCILSIAFHSLLESNWQDNFSSIIWNFVLNAVIYPDRMPSLSTCRLSNLFHLENLWFEVSSLPIQIWVKINFYLSISWKLFVWTCSHHKSLSSVNTLMKEVRHRVIKLGDECVNMWIIQIILWFSIYFFSAFCFGLVPHNKF